MVRNDENLMTFRQNDFACFFETRRRNNIGVLDDEKDVRVS